MKRDPHNLPKNVSRWGVRFVLLGGATAWLLHLIFCYVIAEFGVLSGFAGRTWTGIDAVSWLLFFLSGAMILLAASAVMISWIQRNRFQQLVDSDHESLRTVRFCARFGVAANLTFLAIIAVQTIPIFYFLRT